MGLELRLPVPLDRLLCCSSIHGVVVDLVPHRLFHQTGNTVVLVIDQSLVAVPFLGVVKVACGARR